MLSKEDIEILKGILENFVNEFSGSDLQLEFNKFKDFVNGELFSQLEEFTLNTKRESYDYGKEDGFEEGYHLSRVEVDLDGDQE